MGNRKWGAPSRTPEAGGKTVRVGWGSVRTKPRREDDSFLAQHHLKTQEKSGSRGDSGVDLCPWGQRLPTTPCRHLRNTTGPSRIQLLLEFCALLTGPKRPAGAESVPCREGQPLCTLQHPQPQGHHL